MRLQALVRGRLVRKQAAVTLRCMQALVRVQARVRARRVRMSMEGQAVQNMLNERRTKAELNKEAEVPSLISSHKTYIQFLRCCHCFSPIRIGDSSQKINFYYMNPHQGKTLIIITDDFQKHVRNYLD